MVKKALLAGIALMAVAIAVPAQASAVGIDFLGGTGTSDTILSWAGVGSSLIGKDIPIAFVEGQDTPSNAGFHSVNHGLLSFETGAGTIDSSSSNEVNLTFGGGGSMKLTGGILDAGIADDSVLAEGSFTSGNKMNLKNVSQTISPGNSCQGDDDDCTWKGGFLGYGKDVKLSDLLDFFGLGGFAGDLFTFVDTEILVDVLWNSVDPDTGVIDYTQGFTASIKSTDFNNQAPPIPEPASIGLLGTGLLFVARRLTGGRA